MNRFDELLTRMGDEYKHQLSGDSRNYREVSIGKEAEKYGFSELKDDYIDSYAILPLKYPTGGMKVRIDGRTFVNYAQFDSGIVISGYLAGDSKLPYKRYMAKDSMILNYA